MSNSLKKIHDPCFNENPCINPLSHVSIPNKSE